MIFKSTISIERLRSALEYDPETGLFTWRKANNRRPAGAPAGYCGNRGYIKISLDGQYWLAHRLAWAFVHEELPQPPLQIDHINRIKHDNRLCNLRVVPQGTNSLNCERLLWRAEIARGTTFVPPRKWQAQITVNGTNQYLGLFGTQIEAHDAYRAVAAAIGRALVEV